MEENLDIEKNNKIKKSFWIVFLYCEFIVEFLLTVIIRKFFKCACGHAFINASPIEIAYILKLIIYKLISKKRPQYLSSHLFVWFLIIFEIISFILICVISANNTPDLHTLGIVA